VSPRVTMPRTPKGGGEDNAEAAGSPAVAAAGKGGRFCGDIRQEDIASPWVTIPTFVEGR